MTLLTGVGSTTGTRDANLLGLSWGEEKEWDRGAGAWYPQSKYVAGSLIVWSDSDDTFRDSTLHFRSLAVDMVEKRDSTDHFRVFCELCVLLEPLLKRLTWDGCSDVGELARVSDRDRADSLSSSI